MEPEIPIVTLSTGVLSDFIAEHQKNCAGNGWVFRGQPVALDRLLPSVARDEIQCKPSEVEHQILAELKLRLPSVYGECSLDDWDLLALVQHYGAPTRFLDWSKSPLTALWFAVSKNVRENARPDAAVWAFRSQIEHFVSDDERSNVSPLDVIGFRFFETSGFDKRPVAQQGLFSIHKWWNDKGEFVPLENFDNLRHSLRKFVIPGEFLRPLMLQLEGIAVTAASIYPDLEGLCKHLAIKHKLASKNAQLSSDVNVGTSGQATLS